MYNIGTKIKDLRRGRGMTQEQLADFLQISFQAISKWERGESLPDLTMLAPLARLFNVTTDELLGLTNNVRDQRREELDFACEHGWKVMDGEDEFRLAQEAVKEYPGNLRYLKWLGNVHFRHAWSHEKNEDVHAEFAEGARCCEAVIEYTKDDDLRYGAIHTLVLIYQDWGKLDEARRCAEMLPEDEHNWSDWRREMIAELTPGEEGIRLMQNIVLDCMQKLENAVSYSMKWKGGVAGERLDDLSAAISKLIISDGNYLRFWWNLMCVHTDRAERFSIRGQHDDAMTELREALKCAVAYDDKLVYEPGVHRYTAPVIDRVTIDTKELHQNAVYRGVDSMKDQLTNTGFDPLRDREDFKALVDEINELVKRPVQ